MSSADAEPASSFQLEMFPSRCVHVALFRGVLNVEQVATAARDRMAVIDASLVSCVFQLLVACTDACAKERDDRMKTKNMLSEIVYTLSGSRNINNVLSNFACPATEGGSFMLLAGFNVAPEVQQEIFGVVQGKRVMNLDDELRGGLLEPVRKEKLKMRYKIGEEELAAGAPSQALAAMEGAILTRMAARDL